MYRFIAILINDFEALHNNQKSFVNVDLDILLFTCYCCQSRFDLDSNRLGFN